LPGFAENAPATPALYEGAPLPDAKEGQEEERKVMIHPLQAGLIESAGKADAALIFEFNGLRLNSRDEKKHACQRPFQRLSRIQKARLQVKILRISPSG
jgi:hypothetical protein